MKTQESDSNKKEETIPAERTQGSEFSTDREESPSADWIQHSNEETIIYSQTDKSAGIRQNDNNSSENKEISGNTGSENTQERKII